MGEKRTVDRMTRILPKSKKSNNTDDRTEQSRAELLRAAAAGRASCRRRRGATPRPRCSAGPRKAAAAARGRASTPCRRARGDLIPRRVVFPRRGASFHREPRSRSLARSLGSDDASPLNPLVPRPPSRAVRVLTRRGPLLRGAGRAIAHDAPTRRGEARRRDGPGRRRGRGVQRRPAR